MKSIRSRIGLCTVAFMLVVSTGWGQPPLVTPGATSPTKTFSQQELDQLIAPIALYPDALLVQIFMGATYPLEIVQAARWVKANPNVKEQALENAMQKQPWDPAVKSLTAVPQVLQQMNDKLDWTQKLGDAFLAQQKDVMATVQSLRAKAYAAGNLKSSTQQVVTSEQQDSQTIYIIESSKPEVVYVPIYSPTVVYGTWWYPYPPYSVYPPSYVYPPGVAFTTGLIVGAAIWGNANWHSSSVSVNVSHYNSFNKTTINKTTINNTTINNANINNANINNANWSHNAEHRKGVPYQDQKVAQQYNRGVSAQTAQTAQSEQYRGRAESTQQNMNRNSMQNTAQQADRGQASQRASSLQNSGGGRGSSVGASGFSGIGNGASTQAASARGNVSRGGGGGGRGRR